MAATLKVLYASRLPTMLEAQEAAICVQLADCPWRIDIGCDGLGLVDSTPVLAGQAACHLGV
jgi:hypothetical protein